MRRVRYTLLCNNLEHPVLPAIRAWMELHQQKDQMRLVCSVNEIEWQGDLLFLISYSQIAGRGLREKFKHTLVFHASDLPKGRGWSPHVWDIINGADTITLSMIDAADPVDSGSIWAKRRLHIPKTALYDEINDTLFGSMLELMDQVIEDPESFHKVEQDKNIKPTYFPRRTKKDSKIDPHRSILEQFDLIRVCDSDRYPAYFEIDGERFLMTLRKDEGGAKE